MSLLYHEDQGQSTVPFADTIELYDGVEIADVNQQRKFNLKYQKNSHGASLLTKLVVHTCKMYEKKSND